MNKNQFVRKANMIAGVFCLMSLSLLPVQAEESTSGVQNMQEYETCVSVIDSLNHAETAAEAKTAAETQPQESSSKQNPILTTVVPLIVAAVAGFLIGFHKKK